MIQANIYVMIDIRRFPCQVPGDLASQYNDFLLTEEVVPGTKLMEGDLMIKQNGQLVKPVRLPNGLYKFRSV